MVRGACRAPRGRYPEPAPALDDPMPANQLRLLDEATRPRRRATALPLALAGVALVLLVASMGTLIVRSQHSVRSHLATEFAARGTTSAEFISALLSAEAARQERTASVALSGPVSSGGLAVVARAFGTTAAVVLDAHGRILASVPADRALVSAVIATRFPGIRAATTGSVAVSGDVQPTPLGVPVTAIAVPYATSQGLRVFAVVYAVTHGTLAAFIAHAVVQPHHALFLIDAQGRVLASSPAVGAGTLAALDPSLAAAVARDGSSNVAVDGATSFTVNAVPGTGWRLVAAVPNADLYLSIGGTARWLPWAAFAIVALLALGLWAFFAGFLADRRRLAALSQDVLKLARTDPLTGLPNRLQLSESLARALAGAERYEQPLSLLMIDLDNFKEINDAHGHDVGDRVLQAVSACLREVLREADLYGRWGGDEFLAVLVHTPPEGARDAAQRLCDCAAALNLSRLGIDGGVSMSIGCAPAVGEMPALLQAVDAAMYQAKRSGRGGVFLASGPPAPEDLAA